MSGTIQYVLDGEPRPGETRTVAPGVLWLRMPLPFKLNHINLWLLEDGDGWTAVDTGICRDDVKAAWEQVIARHLDGRPLKRVIVTHFHPDHVGLAGWLVERFSVSLWMPLAEWAFGRMIAQDASEATQDQAVAFYRAAGFDDERMAAVDGRRNRYASNISPIPVAFRRITDGEEIDIGGRAWHVIVGCGHSPEHACLHSPALGVLISGDQILPRISPNISIWPQEPEANPLEQFLSSLTRFRSLAPETLVLPSHDWPFIGLLARLKGLARHHDERLESVLAALESPMPATGVLSHLFHRPLDTHQLFFAVGETLAHLHYLMAQELVTRVRGADGVDRFERTVIGTEGARIGSQG